MHKLGFHLLRLGGGANHRSRSNAGEGSKAALENSDRRSFFRGLASLALTRGAKKLEAGSETVYQFQTPECEVRMSVQHFERSSPGNFRFRDRLTNRGFCLSANGEEDRGCSLQFTGSLAIAIYHFFPRFSGPAPAKLRERVATIDHDSRMATRPPFERDLAIERNMASDIQAFGYRPDDPAQAVTGLQAPSVWSLLHQDLYLNDAAAPFLIVHWKHTLDQITLVDVIPGEQTKLLGP